MKTGLKYLLIIVCACLLAGIASLSVWAGKQSRKAIKCTGLHVLIKDSLENDFVSAEDIRRYLDREYGAYVGQPIDSINLTEIERIIDGRTAVRKSEAYVSKDGLLKVYVTQRKPVVRFQKGDSGFYADSEGYIFPLQSTYASHVQIIDGDIPLDMKSGHKGKIENAGQKKWFESVMKIVNYIENSRIWKDRIVQIHVTKGGELILVPREGRERFIFGQPTDIAARFSKMEKYYTSIAPNKEKGHYRTIDLKYKGQIVCR